MEPTISWRSRPPDLSVPQLSQPQMQPEELSMVVSCEAKGEQRRLQFGSILHGPADKCRERPAPDRARSAPRRTCDLKDRREHTMFVAPDIIDDDADLVRSFAVETGPTAARKIGPRRARDRRAESGCIGSC
jgi:hypothetical protein